MPAKLYFYYSAMNAGKSTTLLQSSYNYNERGMKTLLFIPKLIGKTKIVSRIGLESTAIQFDPDFDFYAHVKAEQEMFQKPSADEPETEMAGDHHCAPCTCLLVDECQFLNRAQVRQLSKICDQLSVAVLCYGLRSDFQGEPFEGSKYLLTLADVITEIKTICSCGRKATMNQRVGPDGKAVLQGEQVEVGGNERYVGKCRKHYMEAMEEAEEKLERKKSLTPVGSETSTPEKTKDATQADGNNTSPEKTADSIKASVGIASADKEFAAASLDELLSKADAAKADADRFAPPQRL